MGFAPQGSDSEIMSDAFMAFRLMMNYLDDLAITIDTAGRIRTSIEASSATLTVTVSSGTLSTVTTVSTVTNLAQIGGNAANSFLFDTMDIVWNTGIRPQII